MNLEFHAPNDISAQCYPAIFERSCFPASPFGRRSGYAEGRGIHRQPHFDPQGGEQFYSHSENGKNFSSC